MAGLPGNTLYQGFLNTCPRRIMGSRFSQEAGGVGSKIQETGSIEAPVSFHNTRLLSLGMLGLQCPAAYGVVNSDQVVSE